MDNFETFKMIKFHTALQSDMRDQILLAYNDDLFLSSACTICSLFERIFVARLVRETAIKKDFVTSKINIPMQLKMLYEKEEKITNIQKLHFRAILKQLVELAILTKELKEKCEKLFDIRNAVMHGLNLRLYEMIYHKKPNLLFAIHPNTAGLYKIVTEIFIEAIIDLNNKEIILKK